MTLMTGEPRDQEAPAELVNALDHIMRVARNGITPTRRLDWIAQRARYALEGKAWSTDIAEEPRDRVAEMCKSNKKLRDERTAQAAEIAALKRDNETLRHNCRIAFEESKFWRLKYEARKGC